MEETVKTNPIDTKIINDQVEELRQYTDGIISVLRKGGDKPIDVKESIDKAFKNYKTKLLDRNINFFIDIDANITTINCDKRFFITMVMNIIDNSIYWLDTIYKPNKSIYVKSYKEDNITYLLIVDNGPGFKDDISELIRPFFSRKSDGIGIGLYLIDTIMLKYGKLDILLDREELNQHKIPEDFDGAAVKLIFNKNQ